MLPVGRIHQIISYTNFIYSDLHHRWHCYQAAPRSDYILPSIETIPTNAPSRSHSPNNTIYKLYLQRPPPQVARYQAALRSDYTLPSIETIPMNAPCRSHSPNNIIYKLYLQRPSPQVALLPGCATVRLHTTLYRNYTYECSQSVAFTK